MTGAAVLVPGDMQLLQRPLEVSLVVRSLPKMGMQRIAGILLAIIVPAMALALERAQDVETPSKREPLWRMRAANFPQLRKAVWKYIETRGCG